MAAAVRDEDITSRKLITSKAIVGAIVDQCPESVLDVGCGEGWLIRKFQPHVKQLAGVDAVPDLIAFAQASDGGEFYVLPYDSITRREFTGSFDAVVCNFSLLGKESVDGLFGVIPSLLNLDEVFIVQTLHPLVACGDRQYVDGWRDGSWVGFSKDFVDPAPWYFRTLESWVDLFVANGFRLTEIREPVHPATGKPASIIFIGKVAANSVPHLNNPY